MDTTAEPYVTVTAKIKPAGIEYIAARCEALGVTRSAFLRIALAEYAARHPVASRVLAADQAAVDAEAAARIYAEE